MSYADMIPAYPRHAPFALLAASMLPGDTTRAERPQMPIAFSRDPKAALAKGQPPIQFWRTVRGEPDPATHVAPPSILQIRITQLLDEQTTPDRDAANGDDPPRGATAAPEQPEPTATNADTDPNDEDQTVDRKAATSRDSLSGYAETARIGAGTDDDA